MFRAAVALSRQGAARRPLYRSFSSKPPTGKNGGDKQAGVRGQKDGAAAGAEAASEAPKGSVGGALSAWLALAALGGAVYVGRDVTQHPGGRIAKQLREWKVPFIPDEPEAAYPPRRPFQPKEEPTAADTTQAEPEPEPEAVIEPEPAAEAGPAAEPEPAPEPEPAAEADAPGADEDSVVETTTTTVTVVEEDDDDSTTTNDPADADAGGDDAAATAGDDDGSGDSNNDEADAGAGAGALDGVDTDLAAALASASQEKERADELAAAAAAEEQARRERDEREDAMRKHLAGLSTVIDQQVADSLRAARSLSENEIVQLIKEDLVSSIARDVDRLSEDDLRERVLKLTTELRDRGKWEALRLNESLKRQDEVWAKRMEETLRAQVGNFEGHLQQIREAEEARALELLKGQHKALLSNYQADVNRQVEAIVTRRAKELQEAVNAKYRAGEEKRQTVVRDLKARTKVAMEALSNRFTYEQVSHRVHKIAVAVLAVEDALGRSGEATEAVAALGAVAGDDVVIAAALKSLPEAITTRGVPTMRNLQARFDTVHTAARRAALANQKGDMIGHAIGYVTSALTVDRTDDSVPDANDPTYPLTAAKAAVAAGDLREAIRQLDSLTGLAAETVSDWKAAAKERMVVGQALRVIKAQAATVTTSLY